MKYKEFTLDQFQVEAIEALLQDNSVIVSAATGTGKTLIADFIINMLISNNEHNENVKLNYKLTGTSHTEYGKPLIVYTAPIKALSNQKFREFSSEYGIDKVGILTGDVQINPTAPLLIMTTEIYRNMLISEDKILDQLRYTIFDEVHYLSDIERGTIWEESIIFSPDHVKFLCLSATVPNADELAGWIRSIKGHNVMVITWDERAVPLKNYLFDKELGLCNYRTLKQKMARELKAELAKTDPKILRRLKKRNRKKWRMLLDKRQQHQRGAPPPNHVELISKLKEKDMLPALIFSFSRKDCQNKANELTRRYDFSTPASRSMVKELFNEHVEPKLHELDSVKLIYSATNHGIGVHHAGLLPALKIIVEKLFSLGHLKVLYATETFALGVNMPARTVGFLGLRKYDGFRNRFLYSNEFSQCAGRAGRRGIDDIGYVVSLIPRDGSLLNEFQMMLSSPHEPIISQFSLSYNTVINLVKNHSPMECEQILKSSFDYYIRRKHKKHMWVLRKYNQFLGVLTKLGYISGGYVTNKGEFASMIYTHELMVTEIFESGIYKELDNIAIAILLTAIMYEERHKDHFKFDRESNYYEKICSVIVKNSVVSNDINYINLKRMCLIVRLWCQGCTFSELMEISNIEEGDIIHIFRNTLDLARQVKHATKEPILKDRMREIIDMIERDVVKFSF